VTDRCGTTGGYQAHRRLRETTCTPCRAAAAADRRYRVAYDYLTGGQRMLIDATGTRRRVQALVRIGWPMKELAGRLGVSFQNVYDYTTRDKVRRSTAAKVAGLYDELSMLPGPSTSAAKRALAKGWPPPLAFDDENLDDPAARPMHDLRGHDPGRPVDTDLQERVLVLTRAGLSAAEISVRLGTNPRYVQRVRARARQENAA
jgi:DNA-binding CsgD family transcriptional regulator